MKYLFYFGHPAQFLFLRESIKYLVDNNEDVLILIKTKDVLEDLIKSLGYRYINISPHRRGSSFVAISKSLLFRIYKIYIIILKYKPEILISTDAPFAILGMIFRINRITITEDDYKVIKKLAILTYPFTQTILCPSICDVGKYGRKKIGYNGYMKLAYLHPNVFSAKQDVLTKYKLFTKYIMIRLVQLSAFHDDGINGVSKQLLDKVIEKCERSGFSVVISSEYSLGNKYSRYIIPMIATDFHDVLSNATLLISDSQSVSVEAAMLGIPSIRISDFAGKISVLEELENEYGLTFGLLPQKHEEILLKLESLLLMKNLKEEFQIRRERMLKEKIDVNRFLSWFLNKYPESRKILMQNPDAYETVI